MLEIYDLRTNHRIEPTALDLETPLRFSWKLKSEKQGVKQVRYRITVWSERGLLWDTGLRTSSKSLWVEYAGAPLNDRETVNWIVYSETEDRLGERESTTSDPASFTMGLLDPDEWIAQWIEPEDSVDREARKPAPYLRKTFLVKEGLRKATAYQAAHGLYEAWFNGQTGTADKFKPGLTSYYYRIQYQVADVTALLKEGENVWAVVLGDGWWRGVTGGTLKNNFGDKLHFFGQLELVYEDGAMEIIGTDETFRSSTGGLLASDMMMGDIYDARQEPDGWKGSGFDDSGWKRVHLATEHTDATLIPSRSVPVREKEVFSPSVFRDASDRLVLDFGQNIAGYVKATFRHTTEGQRICMTYGEDIDADGNFSLANIDQSAYRMDRFQSVEYICSGKEKESYTPLFSYFGFRYLLLEGIDEGAFAPNDYMAVALYSDMEEVGTFSCSNEWINKLVKNSRWSLKGNYLDVAVDCPTREKNSWTGDNQIFVKTATDFMDVYAFYEKWLQDMSLEQYESGKIGITFPSTSSPHDPLTLKEMQKNDPLAALAGPSGNGSVGEDCAGWGDAAAWIPYVIYLCYGDKQILNNQYRTAKGWVDYMLSCARERNPLYENEPHYHTIRDGELDADYIYDTRMHYGEWQEPIRSEHIDEDKGAVFLRWIREGNARVATAYMCRSCENVASMADALGKKGDAAFYRAKAERIRSVYETYLIEEDGTIQPGHQAAYVRALAMELCCGQKRKRVEEKLLLEIEQNGYKLNTGFLSTPFLLPVLADMGRPDLAFRILENTDYPGWLHPVMLGATTIPEAWNAYDVHDSSYNHYSYGAVCDFLFAYVAGIRPMWKHPGYKRFELKPLVGGTFTWAAATLESPFGTIRSSWTLNDGRFQYECEVPVGTEAILTMPSGNTHVLGSGIYKFKE